jgi:hypothetical protein
MIQRGQRLRFALKAREPVRVLRKGLGQDFDRDGPAQLGVGRTTVAGRAYRCANPLAQCMMTTADAAVSRPPSISRNRCPSGDTA